MQSQASPEYCIRSAPNKSHGIPRFCEDAVFVRQRGKVLDDATTNRKIASQEAISREQLRRYRDSKLVLQHLAAFVGIQCQQLLLTLARIVIEQGATLLQRQEAFTNAMFNKIQPL